MSLVVIGLSIGMLLFLLFVLLPIGQSFYYSLYNWEGFGPPVDFIAFGNYERLLNHSIFQLAARNSFMLMALSPIRRQRPFRLSPGTGRPGGTGRRPSGKPQGERAGTCFCHCVWP
mgnify:CR=1 FL=1